MTKSSKLSCDVRVGESLSIGGGRLVIRLEQKSGQVARLNILFTEHTEVQKLVPGQPPRMLADEGASLSP